MLRFFWIISFCLLLCTAARASLARGRFYSEANPGKCTYESLVLSPGETAKSPKECARITCNSDDGWLTIESCISIAPPAHCEWSDYVNVQAPYPACCARNFACREPNPSNQTLADAKIYQENVHNMLGASVAPIANPAVSKHID